MFELIGGCLPTASPNVLSMTLVAVASEMLRDCGVFASNGCGLEREGPQSLIFSSPHSKMKRAAGLFRSPAQLCRYKVAF